MKKEILLINSELEKMRLNYQRLLTHVQQYRKLTAKEKEILATLKR